MFENDFENNLYFGIIAWVGETRRGLIAQLKPLYQSTPDHSSWYPLQDPQQIFPNRGFVTWFNPSTRIQSTPWVFRIEPQSTFNPEDPRHDKYRVVRVPEPAPEILDLRDFGDIEKVRQVLTEEGLLLPYVPSQSVYLWVEDGIWLGPVRLVQDDQSKYWFLEESQIQTPLRRYDPLPNSYLVTLDLGRSRLFLTPAARPVPTGYVDWAPDELILKRVMRSLRKRDREFTDALNLTQKVLDRTARLLSTVGLSREQHTMEVQRLQRAQALISALNQSQELLDKLSEDLLQVPAVAAKIAAAAAAAREEAVAQVQAELAQEIALTEEARQQTEAAKAELEEIKRAIAEKRAEQVALVEAFDAALAQRLADLMRRPEQELAKVALVRAALRLEGTPTKPVRETTGVPGSAPASFSVLPLIWSEVDDCKCIYLNDPLKLRKALREALRARGVPVKAAVPLHAAFLIGAMPVLSGSRAFAALEAYAACVAGSRLLWLPVPPTALEPADLLGRVDPVARRFVPHPGGLLDLLRAASETNDLYLVILEGFNRAATDAYLAPLLACYADAWRETQGRTLPLIHPLAASEDWYARTPFLSWPPNVLLAGIFNEGATSIPPAPVFWTTACLINLDQFGHESATLSASEPVVANVSLETWRAWKASTDSADMETVREVLQSVTSRGLMLRREALEMCERFYAGARTWTEETSAIEFMICHCLVPQFCPEQESLFYSALSDIGRLSEDIETAVQLSRRLLS